MTELQLKSIMPFSGMRCKTYLPIFNRVFDEFEISTPERQAAFLAQVAHESGQLLYVQELATGEAYEGREDLGNTQPGDGKRYKGRGLLQITGRANYKDCGEALGLDLVAKPFLLAEPENAARSAGWFWQSHGLNQLADAKMFERITRRINGGLNGYGQRLAYYTKAKLALGVV